MSHLWCLVIGQGRKPRWSEKGISSIFNIQVRYHIEFLSDFCRNKQHHYFIQILVLELVQSQAPLKLKAKHFLWAKEGLGGTKNSHSLRLPREVG